MKSFLLLSVFVGCVSPALAWGGTEMATQQEVDELRKKINGYESRVSFMQSSLGFDEHCIKPYVVYRDCRPTIQKQVDELAKQQGLSWKPSPDSTGYPKYEKVKK